MLKKFLTMPDTFDLDDRRRRQIMNVLLFVTLIVTFLAFCYELFIAKCNCNMILVADKRRFDILLILDCIQMTTMGILLFANRSSRIPGWLVGGVYLTVLMMIFMQVDTPTELYNGRSTIVWAIPIMLGTIVFHPRSTFMIATVIFGLMEIFTPSHLYPGDSVNYFSAIVLVFIAFVSWLGMSIANRAIRDARHHAANTEAILKNIADGVLVLDLQSNFISANPALLRMIPSHELAEIITKPLGKTIRWKGKVFSVSISEVSKIGTVAVFRDETRRYETERARDSLLATASHELRTPLTAVMNYLEFLQVLIKMGKINTDDFNEHIARALENVKRLQSLVNDILDQAQIQAGVLNLKRDTFDLRSLIEKSHQLLEMLLKEKNLSYELNVASNVPAEIGGDANRLNQVLVNLIGNAIKFTNQGGIKVNVSIPMKEKLSIQVVDSGPGIPPEQLPDIFEAFRRGGDYVQREHQGTGLGLSIAKEIITRMGGEISVSSEPGHGSIFTVLLPMDAV